jgi:hypothetical protein
LKAVLAILAAVSFSACASFSTMKTARAIDPGTSQYSMVGSAVGTTLPNADGSNTATRTSVAPQFELAARYGIVDGFDLGAKLTSLGVELNSTISLVRGNVFDLALAPAVGTTGYSYNNCNACVNGGDTIDVWEIYGKLALLFGLRFGPSHEHEFVFGPEVVPISIVAGDEDTGGGTSQTVVLVGGVAGVSFKVSPGLRIMPELTMLTPASNFTIPDAPLYNRFGEKNAIFYQLGLGFSWGNDGFGLRRPPRPRYQPQYYAPPQQQEYAPPPTYPPPPAYTPPPPPRPEPAPNGDRSDT